MQARFRNRQWSPYEENLEKYVSRLDMTAVYMHTVTFTKKYPGYDPPFPVVLLAPNNTVPTLIPPNDFKNLIDLTDLINLLNERMPRASAQSK